MPFGKMPIVNRRPSTLSLILPGIGWQKRMLGLALKQQKRQARQGRRSGDTPTYRGSEAAPQGLELAHAQVLTQAASWGGGGLHALAIRRGLRKDRTVLEPDQSRHPSRFRLPCRPSPVHSLPPLRRPPDAPGRLGDGSAHAPTPPC